MPKAYSAASEDVTNRMQQLRDTYYPELDGVEIQALFVFVDEPEPCLKHAGYQAYAVTKLTSTRDRAAGLADAMIVIDRFMWEGIPGKVKDALLDHELHHIERVLDKKTDRPQADALGRPKLRLRRHDWQMGWFDVVAQRHGQWSIEVAQAKQLVEQSGQLYLPLKWRKEAA